MILATNADGQALTWADVADARTILSAMAERGLSLADARMTLDAATAEVVRDLASRAYISRITYQPDPTAPSPAEIMDLTALLTRALAVYNARRGPYTVGAAIGTASGIKSINRSATARRVLYKGETDAKMGRLHITKTQIRGQVRHRFTIAATLTTGDRVRALSASIIETPKGLKIAAFNPLHR